MLSRTSRASAIGAPLLILLLLAGLGLRLVIAYVLFPNQGLGSDLSLFTYWAQAAADHGPQGFYANVDFVDYPPGYLWVLWLLGTLGNTFAGILSIESTDVIVAMIKLPAILADLAIAVLLYLEAKSWKGQRAGLVAAALFLFIPVTWYDSALWGQVDSVSTLLMVASMLLLIRGWSEPAAAVALLAALTKPQSAFVLGIVGIVLLRRHLFRQGSGPRPLPHGLIGRFNSALGGLFTDRQGPVRLITSAALAAATGLLVIAPFDLPARAPNDIAGTFLLGHLAGLLAIFGAAAQFYVVLTVNAFNPWALVGPTPLTTALSGNYQWTFDSLPIVGGISAVIVGIALFLTLTAGVVIYLLRRDDRWAITIAFTVLALGLFFLPTRVHERYLYPVFSMAAILGATVVTWRLWYIALGIANVANLHAILTLPIDGYGTPQIQALPLGDLLRQPWAITAIVVTQAALFVWGLLLAYRGRPDEEWSNRMVAVQTVHQEIAVGEGDHAIARADGDALSAGIRERLGPVMTVLAAVFAPMRARLFAPPINPPSEPGAHEKERGRIFDRRDLLAVVLVFLVLFGTRLWRLETPPTIYFDETFHSRSGMEFLQYWRYGIPHDITEKTHPHLAKYLIAAGIASLGNSTVVSTTRLAPARDAASELVRSVGGPTTPIIGDRIAIATGDGVLLINDGDVTAARLETLPGARTVMFDPSADRLLAATDDGRVWLLDATSLVSAETDAAHVGTLAMPAVKLAVLADGRAATADEGGTVSLIDTNTGTTIATSMVADLRDLLAVNVDGVTRLFASNAEGVTELDTATLALVQQAPLPGAAEMVVVNGSERLSLDRGMRSRPTLFVATDSPRIEAIELDAAGGLAQVSGAQMPGIVRDVLWNETQNMVYALGTGTQGRPVIYTVDPVVGAVFADVTLPFEPTTWVLDTQASEPRVDRQRALTFGEDGSVAITALGDFSFAGRLPGALAGAVMGTLMYLLARILFRRRSVAVLAAIAIALEGLLFSQSRIAMNDAFAGVFIVAALTVLAYLFEVRARSPGRVVGVGLGLLVVGLLFGLALASKWVAVYAIGVAILLILLRSRIGSWIALAGFVVLTALLGWLALETNPPNFLFLILMVVLTAVVALHIRRSGDSTDNERSRPAWLVPTRRFGLPFIWAMACLTVVPLVVYGASFVPWAQMTNSGLQAFIDTQFLMYRFHDELRTVHGASSPWWAWPLGLKPVWGYFTTFPDGTQSMVFSASNPVLLWLSIPAIALAAWRAWKHRSEQLAFAVIVFLAMWLPWVRIERFTVNYHYYVALPFALLLLGYLLGELWRGPTQRVWILGRVAFAVVLLMPVLLWLAKGPLCDVAGVAQVNPEAFVCETSLVPLMPFLMAWWIAALIAGWLIISLRRPRTLVVAILVAAAVVLVTFYPFLAAWRLPNLWPLAFQSLLPTWDGSFQFASNTNPYVATPWLSLGVLLIGLVVGVMAWWIAAGRRRGSYIPGPRPVIAGPRPAMATPDPQLITVPASDSTPPGSPTLLNDSRPPETPGRTKTPPTTRPRRRLSKRRRLPPRPPPSN